MALFVEGAAAPARYLLVTEPSAVKKRQVKAWSELGTRAGRTRKVREVRTRTTRATTCLLSCMAAANVGLWPGASQGQAVDGEQKEVTIWSVKVVAESDSHGDAESELGYPNVTTAVGYCNFPFLLDAGSITDDDFVWKGRTQTVISLAQMSEGEVTGKAFNGDPIIAYDAFWTELQLSPGVTRDADVTRLTLYIDGKKLSFSHDPGCSICSSTWERQSTTPAYLWRYGPPTPVRITELRTNQAATVSLPMIDATGGFHVGQTLIALRSRVADGNGTTGSTFKSQWFHVDEDGGNRTAISGVMDDRTYKLKIPDFGKYLQAAIIFTDDDTFEETVYSEIVGPITSVPWQPENLTATPATESVSLSWTPGGDNGSPITSYQVRYRKGNGAWSDWTTITGSSASTTSHEVTGLDENSSYTLEVRAVNDAGGGVPAQVQTTTLLVLRATITGVTITSDPNDDGRTGNDDTYAFGDTITLEITFSKAIDVTQGAPQAAARRPPYVAEEGRCTAATDTTTLTCTYTVQSGDLAVNGLPIPAHRLGGTTIANAGTAYEIGLQVAAHAPDPDHKIDGVIPFVVTRGNEAPGTSGDGSTITLYTNKQALSVGDATKFTIHIGIGNTLESSGTATSATVSGRKITLTHDLTVEDKHKVLLQLAAGALEDNVGTATLPAYPSSSTTTWPRRATRRRCAASGPTPGTRRSTCSGTRRRS